MPKFFEHAHLEAFRMNKSNRYYTFLVVNATPNNYNQQLNNRFILGHIIQLYYTIILFIL